MSCPFDDYEKVFGPAVDPCRGRFDFTLFFEETILTILPAGVFLIAAVVRLVWFVLCAPPRKVVLSALYLAKLVGHIPYFFNEPAC